jgi:hypothetical protein
MKKLELILSISSFVGIQWIMFFLIPGGTIILILSMFMLSLLYFFLSFVLFNNIGFRKIFRKVSYKDTSSNRILFSFVTGIFLSATVFSILFKLLFWSYASIILMFGIIGLFVISVILIRKRAKVDSPFYSDVLKRTIVACLVATILSLIPSQLMAKIRYREEPEYANALIDVMNNPNNAEYQRKLDDENEKRFEDE